MSKATARDALERLNCRGTCGDMGETPCFWVAPNWKACDGCARWATYQLDTLRAAGLVVVPSGAIHKALQDAFQAGAIKAIEQHGISMPLGEDGLLPFLKAKHRYCDEELDRLIAASQEDKG